MGSQPGKAELTCELKAAATQLGFVLSGACPAVPAAGFAHLQAWLASGYAGEMRYLTERAAAYEHPRGVMDGVRSLLMLALPYRSDEPNPTAARQGRISRYAWGAADYHDVVHSKLKSLAATARRLAPEVRVRGVTDTAPLLERDFAQLAGLGWIGKNTMLINRLEGSWFFLAALLLDCELEYDQPHAADHCGTCTACLDACPTAAFPEPYVLDARRCISYLTIELRSAVPAEFRPHIADWLFGCDVCQDVCPWNRKSSTTTEPGFWPVDGGNPVELLPLFALDDDQFRQRFRHTPLWRTRRRGVLRNAAIVLGNHPTADAVPALQHGLADREPIVRAACAWALGRIGTAQALDALHERREKEMDAQVIQEIEIGLR